MAQPQRVYDSDSDERPVTRPNLHLVGNEKPADETLSQPPASAANLNDYRKKKAAKADEPKSLSPEQLQEAESETSAKTSPEAIPGTAAESESLYHPEENKRSLLKGGAKKKKHKSKKGLIAILGSVGGLGILVLLIAFFTLAGSLKYVHFATVLRSAGFARFNYQMSQEYSQTIFDTAVMDPNATGSFNRDLLGDRSIFDIIRGVNPEQQLIDLGRSEDVKFNFSANKDWLNRTTNSFESVNIAGQDYSLDATAQELYGTTYSDLALNPIKSFRVRAQVSSDVRDALSQDLELEGRDLVASLKGIQAAFGIKLYGVVNGGRDFLNKATQQQQDAEAAKENYDATQGDATGTASVDGEDPNLNAEAQDAKDAIDTALNSGQIPDVPTVVADVAKVSGVAGAAQDAKNVAGGVLILTAYCTLRDLDQSAGKIDQANQANAVRQGAHIQSMSDQIKIGDVTSESVQGETDSLGPNPETASLYAEDIGQPVSGTPSDIQNIASLNASGPFAPGGTLDRIYQDTTTALNAGLNKIPVVSGAANLTTNSVCSVILNPAAQISLAVGEIIVDIGSEGSEGAVADSLSEAFTAGLEKILAGEANTQVVTQGAKFALVYGGLNYLGNTLSSYVQKLSGLDYSGLSQNADLYNQAHIGTSYMAQSSSRITGYGAPLSNTDAAQTQTVAMENLKEENDQAGAYNRYFAISNPFSLMGNIVAAVPSSFADLSASISDALPALISKLGSFMLNPDLMINLFGGKDALAAASESIDEQNNYFGVQQWGWTPTEMQTIESDPSYSLVANAQYVESPQNYQRLKNAYNQCYQSAMQNIPGDPSTTPAICTSTVDYNGAQTPYLGTPDALHWRKYMADKYVETQLCSNALSTSSSSTASQTCTGSS